MGTPGDKSRIEKLSESTVEERDEEDSPERTTQTQQVEISSSSSQAPEMTIISNLPHFTTLIDYFIEPNIKNEEINPPKLEQTYIDEFYAEHKYIPTQSEPYQQLFQVESETKLETFPRLDQPGPSGLQTPKTKVSTKVNIKRIKKSQSTKKLHTCQICQKTFQNSNKLIKHQQIHTNSSPFKCEHCKKSFSSKFKLVRHVLIHSDRKPFSCSVCERTFHRKDHLKNHIKVHSPCKKLYICEKVDCKKEYTSSLSYKKHLALHAAEEGILDCQICLKTFKTKEEILYHLKIHAGSRTVKNPDEKKYSCDHCQRKFFTRKDVRRHLVVHTGKRDFLCQFCPQRFGRKDHLVRHIKKSHTKQVDSLVKEEKSSDLLIKSEAEESNLSNPEVFTSNLDLDSLLTENFPMLESTSQQFLPQTSSQGELTDLGSEVLNEIGDTSAGGMFQDNLITDSTLIDLLQPPENLPLPAFSQIFQTPPQPPPQ